MAKWIRIPNPIDQEADRRAITGILTAAGLEVRVVMTRATSRTAYARHIEFRPGPEPKTLDGKKDS